LDTVSDRPPQMEKETASRAGAGNVEAPASPVRVRQREKDDENMK
jgi:hypothetical protein